MPVTDGVGRTIRDYLRDGTSVSHAQLDTTLGALVEGSRADYAAFLEIQYRARVGVERWLARECPDAAPPQQTHLIERDLAVLDHPLPRSAPAFTAPPVGGALGVCWVLAGSSLGNRAILARISKRGAQWPTAFLSDTRMTAYWRSLLPTLSSKVSPSEDDAKILGARATFAHFNAVAIGERAAEAA